MEYCKIILKYIYIFIPLKIIVHALLILPPGEQPKINKAKLSAFPKLKNFPIANASFNFLVFFVFT